MASRSLSQFGARHNLFLIHFNFSFYSASRSLSKFGAEQITKNIKTKANYGNYQFNQASFPFEIFISVFLSSFWYST